MGEILFVVFVGFLIKTLWDGIVRLPKKELEKQVEFLIARYASSILYPNPNPEEEIKRIEFQADKRMNLPVGKSEYENYTDENIELLVRVYKKIQKYIEEDRNEANK